MKRKYEIIGAPFDLAANERGAGEGPRWIRENWFSKRLPKLARARWGIQVSDGGDVSPPSMDAGDSERSTRSHVVASYCQHLFERITESYDSDHTPLLLGGDHSVSIASVSAAASFLRKKRGNAANLGLLWMDAHAEWMRVRVLCFPAVPHPRWGDLLREKRVSV